MKCPRCNQTLEKVKTEYGIVAMCQSCFGHFLLEKNILQYIPADKWNKAILISLMQLKLLPMAWIY
ncbi:MAG: zf-TFIIB domain-containing protein [Leptospiraceae bacterium]|nr:zf-TFIIB domain-containing protein [Leptospiraceae bacterium]